MRKSIASTCGALLAGIALSISLSLPVSASIEGEVWVVPDNKPLAQAAVTLNPAPGQSGPSSVTVFTDANGHFRFPDDVGSSLGLGTLDVRKLGYRLSGDDHKRGIRLDVEPISNIADSAPASAWMEGLPETEGKHLVNLQCSGCHQFPTEKVRGYARLIEEEKAPEGLDAKALEAWRKGVRMESWRAVLKYMRTKLFTIFPEQSTLDFANLPWPLVQSEQASEWTDAQAEIIARFLAENFPANSSELAANSYSYGAPLGVTERTVIREFALPSDSLVREAVMVRNSPYIWGADVRKNRLLRLDPHNNMQTWYPVPFKGATGPHTIVGDVDGKIWLSMIDNDQFGRFDPQTKSWNLWTLTPKNLQNAGALAGQVVVHDIGVGTDGELRRDQHGRIWLTLIGVNMMGAINPDTGEVSAYPAPAVKGFAAITTSLYGTVVSEDRKCAWFTQLNGYFGCFNTETHQPESLILFPQGTGPRRMARDHQDTIWVPLYGSGQILKYDGKKRRILATYDLPDRRAAPYALAWDEKRRVLWVTTSNSDVIYRFDPKTEHFTVYPLPRRQAYLRQLSIDPGSGRLVGSYGNIPAGSGPSMAVLIDVGD
jgi:streptogramin lyase